MKLTNLLYVLLTAYITGYMGGVAVDPEHILVIHGVWEVSISFLIPAILGYLIRWEESKI